MKFHLQRFLLRIFLPLILFTPMGKAFSQPAENCTPLCTELARLNNSPIEVKWHLFKSVIKNSGMEFWMFQKMSPEDRDNAARKAYFIAALDRSFLLAETKELADILNKIGQGSDPEATVMEFENKYIKTFGKYPNIVPVDTAKLRERLLNQMKIQ